METNRTWEHRRKGTATRTSDVFGFSSAIRRRFSARQRILDVTASLLDARNGCELERIVGTLNLEPTRKVTKSNYEDTEI
jgi:hypothetical protein